MDNDLNYGGRERLIDRLEQYLDKPVKVSVNESVTKENIKIANYKGKLKFVSTFTFGIETVIGKTHQSKIVKSFKLSEVLIDRITVTPEEEAE